MEDKYIKIINIKDDIVFYKKMSNDRKEIIVGVKYLKKTNDNYELFENDEFFRYKDIESLRYKVSYNDNYVYVIENNQIICYYDLDKRRREHITPYNYYYEFCNENNKILKK